MCVLHRLPVSLAMALSVLAMTAASLRAQTHPDEVGSTARADSAEATGQDSDRAPDQEIVQNRKLPILDGHRFIPTSTVPDPFITTYLRSNTGFGLLLDTSIPVLALGDTLTILEGDIAFAVLGIEYQQAIVDFLALRIGFDGAVRTGTSGESLVAEGLSASYSFGVGVTGRVFHSEKFLLSAVADFSSNRLLALDPFGFAQRIVDDCEGLLPDPVAVAECIFGTERSLLEDGRSNAITAGARAAWSPIDWFGLRARAEVGVAEPFEPNARLSATVLSLGLVADFDLLEVSRVPLGFLLGYDGQLFGNRSSGVPESASRFNFGLFYTGRAEFSAGVDGILGKVALERSGKSVTTVTINLLLRYFF